MVIIKILGGLASQIGKYSFGYEIAKGLNTELVLDISDYLNGYFRPIMLEYLNISGVRIVNGISGFRHLTAIGNGDELIKAFEENNTDNLYIFCEEKDYESFFAKYPEFRLCPCSDVILNFEMKDCSVFVEQFKHIISNQLSIAVHIRRGDFVQLNLQDDISEYKAVIGFLMAQYSNAMFYFFSNDIEWVKTQFGKYEKFVYMDNHNGNKGDLEDFVCLTLCDFRILSSVSGYGKYANYISIGKYGSKGAYCVRNAVNESGIACLTDEEKTFGRKKYNSVIDNQVPLKAYQLISYKNQQINRSIAECDVTDYSKTEKEAYWSKEYGIGKLDTTLIFVSAEKYDCWSWNGVLQIARIFARCGNQVLYINLNRENNTKEITRAANMDGLDQEFDIVFCSYDVNLHEIAQKWGKENSQVISDVFITLQHSYIKIIRGLNAGALDLYRKRFGKRIKSPVHYIRYNRKKRWQGENMHCTIDEITDVQIEQVSEKNEVEFARKLFHMMTSGV